MKKCVIALLATMVLTACEKPLMNEEDGVDGNQPASVADGKKFTFTVKGDFTTEWKSVTRGYLSADGKDMTDLWILDYMGDVLVQQIHQSDNTAEDFGRPSMTLAYGSHHVYFVASRGASPTLNTTSNIITWATVRDTFWKDYEVDVVNTINGNRAVTLDRVVTKLVLNFTDAVSADASTINITPATWYYGMNYKTGEPATATTSQTNVITVPEGYAGRTDVTANFFSISPSTEWNTNITINSKDGDGNIIGQATISAAPFRRNRVTEYSGSLFSSGGVASTSLNSEWTTSYEGTW